MVPAGLKPGPQPIVLGAGIFTSQAGVTVAVKMNTGVSINGGRVVEYDSNVNIFELGIRSAPEGLAFTSVRAAYK